MGHRVLPKRVGSTRVGVNKTVVFYTMTGAESIPARTMEAFGGSTPLTTSLAGKATTPVWLLVHIVPSTALGAMSRERLRLRAEKAKGKK